MYGWRGKIGLILPSGNTTMEPEFYRMAPEGISIHASRMELDNVTERDLINMANDTERAAKELLSANVNVLVYGCTTGSLVKGYGFDLELKEKMEKVTKIPSTTTATAVVSAIKSLDLSKIAVATPYSEELNNKEKKYLEDHGIDVISVKGLGLVKMPDIQSQHPIIAFRLAKEVNTNKAEGIFISCTGFRTIEIIETLEKDLGKPIITSNQATMAMCLMMLGVKESIEGYGILLKSIQK